MPFRTELQGIFVLVLIVFDALYRNGFLACKLADHVAHSGGTHLLLQSGAEDPGEGEILPGGTQGDQAMSGMKQQEHISIGGPVGNGHT